MDVNSNTGEFASSGRSHVTSSQRKNETPSGSRRQVRCDFCNKKFGTIRGKHIHENRIHPLEYHKDRAGHSSAKARWTSEEYCMLAAMEAEMIRNGVYNVNKELHKRFGHRTLNAIKSHRLADKYKVILERYLTCPTTTTMLTETSNPTTISCQGSSLAEERNHRLPVPNLHDTESWRTLADAELNLGGLHKNRINISLQQQFPTLDVDTIKKIRNKPQCRKLLSNMITSDVKADFKATTSCAEIDLENVVGLLQFIEKRRFLLRMTDDEFRTLIDPNEENEVKRSIINMEFERWISETIPKKTKKETRECARQNPELREGDRVGSNNREFVKTANHQSKRAKKLELQRQHYAKIQRMFKKSKSLGAQFVLSGDNDKDSVLPADEALLEYWEKVFIQKSKSDRRPLERAVDAMEEMDVPVTADEIILAARNLKDSAPGLDGMKKVDLDKIAPEDMATHMTLWLFNGCPPDVLKKGIVTCIPKKQGTLNPGDFRPITVGPIMGRLFHRVLSRRMLTHWPLSNRQKAFRHGDGLADNIWLVKAIIKKKREQKQRLNLTFIDVSKAFDSVSHQSIVRAAYRLGTPPFMLRYISEAYRNCSVQLKIGGKLSHDIPVNRGVRQGDPMSPLLFNAVIDMVMAEIDPSIGVTGDINSSVKCNYMAFADDLILLSSTDIGMKKLMEKVEGSLAKVGLSINAQKCSSLRAEVQRKNNPWIVNPDPYLEVNQHQITAMNILDTYKYLGADIGPRLQYASIGEKIQNKLHLISRAPLKPNQKLYILRSHLIPSLVHYLTFNSISLKSLSASDTKIRSAVRQWLRLPKDTPVAFFHAGVKDGGLGLLQLRKWVPIIRVSRMSAMVGQSKTNEDEFLLDTLQGNSAILCEYRKFGKSKGPAAKKQLKHETAASLYDSVDGYGLQSFSQGTGISDWIVDGQFRMPPSEYIQCIKVRAAVLPTNLRISRYHPDMNTYCDSGCGAFECLDHILQVCPGMDAARRERHNSLVRQIEKRMTKKGYITKIEPRINMEGNLRIPDLVAWERDQAVVCDVTIVSDLAPLDEVHLNKVQKYDDRDMHVWMTNNRPSGFPSPQKVLVTAFVCNWRGVISSRSYSSWRGLGFSRSTLMNLSTTTLSGSYLIWKHHKRKTQKRWRKRVGL